MPWISFPNFLRCEVLRITKVAVRHRKEVKNIERTLDYNKNGWVSSGGFVREKK